MKRLFVPCLFVVFLCGCESTGGSSGRGAAAGDEQQQHRLVTPGELKWEPGPPSLPPGAQVAKLEGDPAKAEFFAMRLRLPDGYRIAPHWHPKHERVTVISGTLHLGQGESFDRAAAHALPVGSYATMSPGMRHFAFAKGVTEIQ